MPADASSLPRDAAAVLEFWFGAPPAREARSEWFRKDPAFDALIRERFGTLIERALRGELACWAGRGPQATLALVIVLDQFTRNAFRDTPKMFAGDAAALTVARRIVAEGWDTGYDPLRRWFCYLPFEHSESLDDQRESLRLFARLRDDPLAGGAWTWAVRHHEVIERFGRYPHRNAILGRASTPAEEAFLREPGSRF